MGPGLRGPAHWRRKNILALSVVWWGVRAKVLGRWGGLPPLIQERVLYPALARRYRAGACGLPAFFNPRGEGRVRFLSRPEAAFAPAPAVVVWDAVRSGYEIG